MDAGVARSWRRHRFRGRDAPGLDPFGYSSRYYCRWARAYYLRQKDGGRKHHTAVCALVFKWQRIIWKCRQQCAPYNEGTYMRSLQKRNPELYQLALDTTLPRHASN